MRVGRFERTGRGWLHTLPINDLIRARWLVPLPINKVFQINVFPSDEAMALGGESSRYESSVMEIIERKEHAVVSAGSGPCFFRFDTRKVLHKVDKVWKRSFLELLQRVCAALLAS